MVHFKPVLLALALGALMDLGGRHAAGQPPASATAPPTEAGPNEAAAAGGGDTLSGQQQALAEKYRHLEEVLIRMAELSSATDPARAALLKKAVSDSKERRLAARFDTLATLLQQQQFSRAANDQLALGKDLQALLALLLSENRAKRIASEKARLREQLERLDGLIDEQKDLQAETMGDAQQQPLSDQQAALAEKAAELLERMREGEEQGAAGQDPSGVEKQPAQDDDTPQQGPTQAGGQPAENGPEASPESPQKVLPVPQPGSDARSSGSESEGGKAAAKSTGKKAARAGGAGESESGGDKPGDQSAQEESGQERAEERGDGDPAQSRVEAARQRMQEAEARLERAERDGAVQKQEEAIQELEQAKADLERILRQLREEEIGQTLAAIEARLMKMLQEERAIAEATERLAAMARGKPLAREQEIEASRLGGRQTAVVAEADEALALLRDEGSAVAFPAALDQVRGDMVQVAERLARGNVDSITRAIEQDVIAALEEMTAALRKAIDEAEKRRAEAEQGQPPGEAAAPSLIDTISELKMIRSLQLRVNKRTELYAPQVAAAELPTADVRAALERLAVEQERVFRITRDLQLGKNR